MEEPLVLECGGTLQNLRIYYTVYGELNKDRSNVVWVFHALTANYNPKEWWIGVVGEDTFINPADYFIVCAGMVGSCYGGPQPLNYGFPLVTIRDMVSAHELLRRHLEIDKIKIGIGGSMGGQQLLEWAVQKPDLFETIVPIATNAKHSAWGIAFNEAQRMALKSASGIEAARAIAMLSYRHYETFERTQSDKDERLDHFSAALYQQYQGEKLRKRFSPLSYYYLSKAMDSHNVGRHFDGIKNALSRIKSKTIIIGIDTDILFPIKEQHLLNKWIKASKLNIVKSHYGHDGFLIETEKINEILKNELA